jgi:putative ATP-binding cassette transporter
MTTIELNTVRFSYTDRDGNPLFTVGPLDLTLKQGEVLLIVGGNGSGKSTLLKLLTSLYYPSSGEIRVNGLDARTVGYRTYRELFSAIFADYHLFERLYGVSGVDDKRVVELLRLMGLERKTTWRDGRFANQELSTGQRKRLALIISLLEDKQIYVFDEWAADQDPSFREFFYETLLPEMKRGGKTVVAATHDERYFHVGDRVLKMEAGRFIYDSDTTKIGPR